MTLYTVNLNPSIAYQANSWLSIGGGLAIEYANLNQTVALPLSPTIDGFTAVAPSNWNNTYRVGLGGRYQVKPSLLLQAGASYDSSPTSTAKRMPDLPADRQIRIGAGILYALIKEAKLGVSYEYMNLGQASINNTSSLGTLSGSYGRDYANVFQISLNVDC